MTMSSLLRLVCTEPGMGDYDFMLNYGLVPARLYVVYFVDKLREEKKKIRLYHQQAVVSHATC